MCFSEWHIDANRTTESLIMSSKYGLTFNPLKTGAVLFTFKKLYLLPQLVFDNTPIRFVDRDKHLVFTLCSIGHIDNIVISLTRILEIMRKLKYSISRNALNQMYMSYLLPIVEYACFV